MLARRHRRRSPQLPVSALPQVDYPTIVVLDDPARRQRRDHGVGGHDAARATVRPDAVAHADDERLELRLLADHAAVRPRTANIDAAQQDVQAAINAASSLLPRQLPTPPTYSKSNPADQPILTLADQLGRAAARSGRRLHRLDPRAEDLAGRRASASSPSTAGRSRRCACRSTREALAGTGLTLEDVRSGARGGERQPAQGQHRRAAPGLRPGDQRSALQGRRLQAARHRLRERLARAPDSTWRRWSTASRTRSSPAGPNKQRAIILNVQRQPGANVIAGGRPREGAAAAAAGVAAAGDRREDPDRPHRDRCAPRSRTSRFTLCSRSSWSSRVIFLLPAQRARDDHPQRRGAAVAHRHVRRDVRARLQPEQPVADGADHRDRLRRRRRHRHDREHLPAHRGGDKPFDAALKGAGRSASRSCR